MLSHDFSDSMYEYEKEEVIGWLNLSDKNGEFSSVLIEQLTYGVVKRNLHVHCIYDAIKAIACAPYKLGQTKKASVFKRPPLQKLWHKHFFQPSFIAPNIYEEMKKGANCEQAFNRVMKKSDEFLGHLIHEVTIGFYEKRSRENKLTGEWLVYLAIKGKNYYLTLGTHGEDKEAYQNVRNCFSEFPELKNYLES